MITKICSRNWLIRILAVLGILLGLIAWPGAPTSVQAQSPHMLVFPEWEWLDALDWPDGEVVATLLGQEGCVTSNVSEAGFTNMGFPEGCNVQIGDTVEMTGGGTTILHTVLNLSVVEVDIAADTIRGTADPGQEVEVWPHTAGQMIPPVPAGTDGIWLVEFSGTYDLQLNESGRAVIYDEGGSGTAVDWTGPTHWMLAFPQYEAVEGWQWPLGATVTMKVFTQADQENPVVTLVGTSDVTTWGDPRTYVRFEFADQHDLIPGDIVELTDGTTIRQHTVLPIEVTGADAGTDVVSGTAGYGQYIQVWPHGFDVLLEPKVGLDGSWTADYSSIFDLLPGMGGRAHAIDGGGSATALDWSIEAPFWRDDFDADPGDPWVWVNPVPDKVWVQDGFLNIINSAGPTAGEGAENLLLRPVADGDLMIKTHLLFEPNANYQFAGLVIYQDEGNFLQFGRAYCDNPEGCVGNGIYFDKVQDGGMPDPNFATPVDVPDEAYLRLERRGEMVRGFFSYDGVTWFEIGTHWLPEGFQVNAVGLTASQDFFTPETDVTASFDFFELTEGWGFLPEGYHDHDSGDVPRWACNAGGWAVDPDNRFDDLWVDIEVDGMPYGTPAGEFRQDLLDSGQCWGGTCGFFMPLLDTLTLYEEHSVAAYAWDLNSGERVLLSSSPKPLTCRTYDIYAFDPLTGQTQQLTDLRDSDEYAPTWSPNGKKIATNTVFQDGSVGITITDLKTGNSQMLAGTYPGGSWATWSPNGQKIAFDFSGRGEMDLYLVPANGGDPVLVRLDAVNADWSPNGRRLVFQQPSDGSIWTSGLSGEGPFLVASSGANPDWSPDGRWIAYEDGGDIWKIAVNIQGMPLADPVRVTSVPSPDGHPTWSPDSRTIVFHAGHEFYDYDLWSVPAEGGMPTWLTGAPNFGDYDPAYAMNSSTVAYASFSPNGQAARSWVAASTFDLPAGYWTEGEHSYRFHWGEGETGGDVTLNVSSEAEIYDGIALLRPGFVLARLGEEFMQLDTIHPDQPTRLLAGWTFDGTFAEARDYFQTLGAGYSWDDHAPVEAFLREINPFYGHTWWPYVNTFTYPDYRAVNIGSFNVEWSPENPEQITSLRWKGSDNLAPPVNVEFFGNAWASEGEGTEDFWFASLVGMPTAGGWSQLGTQVEIGTFNTAGFGSGETPVRTTYQFFSEPLFANLLQVQREFSFGDTAFTHDFRPFIPRLSPLEGFSQVIYPDLSGINLITRDTNDCPFGCTYTDWNGTWFAIHNPTTGVGMVVMHAPSPYPVALWVDNDGDTFSNSTSVLLLQPEGGFTGKVVETETIAFYSTSTWYPALALPPAWTPSAWLPLVPIP